MRRRRSLRGCTLAPSLPYNPAGGSRPSLGRLSSQHAVPAPRAGTRGAVHAARAVLHAACAVLAAGPHAARGPPSTRACGPPGSQWRARRVPILGGGYELSRGARVRRAPRRAARGRARRRGGAAATSARGATRRCTLRRRARGPTTSSTTARASRARSAARRSTPTSTSARARCSAARATPRSLDPRASASAPPCLRIDPPCPPSAAAAQPRRRPRSRRVLVSEARWGHGRWSLALLVRVPPGGCGVEERPAGEGQRASA